MRLNQGQLELLQLLFKFRFGTRELIAEALGKSNGNAIYSKLNILVRDGLIGRRFEPSYKLAGRSAEYYLLPPGLRTLKEQSAPDGLDDKAIKASYKDKSASDQFIKHSLAVFAVSNRLTYLYSNLQLFTKRQLAAYDYFPKPLPDGFVSLKVRGEVKHFFLELIDSDTPPFVIDRRLRQYIGYFENDSWAITELPFPGILCICQSGSVEKRLQKQINRALGRSDTDIPFFTTTLPAIANSTTEDDAIWSNVSEPEKLCSLDNLNP